MLESLVSDPGDSCSKMSWKSLSIFLRAMSKVSAKLEAEAVREGAPGLWGLDAMMKEARYYLGYLGKVLWGIDLL